MRIEAHVIVGLDELTHQIERRRSYLIAQAVREFLEREYASLSAIRDGEDEIKEGKGIPHDPGLDVDLGFDLIGGEGRPKAFRRPLSRVALGLYVALSDVL